MASDGQSLDLGKVLILSTMDVEPGHEDEFNRWFNEEHFPERLQVPGFVWGRRYRVLDPDARDPAGTPKYIVLFGLENEDVLTSEAYMKIRPSSEWRDRVIGHVKKSTRALYADITPRIQAGYEVKAVRKSAS